MFGKQFISFNFRFMTIFLFACFFSSLCAAAPVAYSFQSTGSDGGEAVGFVQWETELAPNSIDPANAALTGLSSFSWMVSGGDFDGVNINTEDLNFVIYDSIDNGLINGFTFGATKGTFETNGGAGFINLALDFGNFADETFTHSGFSQVAPVPLPAAIVMFIPGLIGLLGFSHRRKQTTS